MLRITASNVFTLPGKTYTTMHRILIKCSKNFDKRPHCRSCHPSP